MRGVPLVCAAVFLSGCGLDPHEALEQKLASPDRADRVSALSTLAGMSSDRSLRLIADAAEGDRDVLEEAGNALALRGRAWRKRHPRRRGNPAMALAGDLAKRCGLEPAVRAKAVWALGEMMDRRAVPFVLDADASDSTAVAREVGFARDKLGFTDRPMAFELLGHGRTLSTYDFRERGFAADEGEPG